MYEKVSVNDLIVGDYIIVVFNGNEGKYSVSDISLDTIALLKDSISLINKIERLYVDLGI